MKFRRFSHLRNFILNILKISVYNLHFILCKFSALRYTFGIVKYVL